MSTSTISEHAKLAELRAKTDRQLIRLVSNDLELGLKLAGGCGQDRERAARACAEASQLLPKVYSLTERLRLEKRLGELRAALEEPRACTAGGSV